VGRCGAIVSQVGAEARHPSVRYARRVTVSPIAPQRARVPPRLALRGAAAAALLAAGCWDDPVKETLTVDLRERDQVTLTVVVELDTFTDYPRGSAGRRTLEETAADLLAGRQLWNDRFARLRCDSDGTAWERSGDQLRRYELHARCANPASLAELLADLNVGVELRWEGEEGELRLSPGATGAASRDERRRLERELDGWSADVASYLKAALVVARRAAAEPARASKIWTAALDQEEEPMKALTETERAEVERLGETMEKVYAGFERAEGASESLDARARRAFDPLPDRVEIVAPGTPLEVTGFVGGGDGRWVAPPTGLLAALKGLEGRWLEPDPLWTILESLRSETNVPVAIGPFVAGSIIRSEELPDDLDLRREVESLLSPPPELALVWRLPPKQN
jgi:hypothetical protein